jgi:Flp pilus assembly protein TadG
MALPAGCRRHGTPATVGVRRSPRGDQRAQGLVEFALAVPLIFTLLFVTVDLGRLIYTYNAISSAARDGARLVALRPQLFSDCLALQRLEQVGQAFPLLPDPNSINNQTLNTDPNNPGATGPTTPPPGVGYIYIWPAAAAAVPQDSLNASGGRNCDNSVQRGGAGNQVKHVAVELQYVFRPLMPLISRLMPNSGITIRTISVVQTEY